MENLTIQDHRFFGLRITTCSGGLVERRIAADGGGEVFPRPRMEAAAQRYCKIFFLKRDNRHPDRRLGLGQSHSAPFLQMGLKEAEVKLCRPQALVADR